MRSFSSPRSLTGSPPEQLLDSVLEALRPELLGTLREILRIPSENLPPAGNECPCQLHIAAYLRRLGIEPDVIRYRRGARPVLSLGVLAGAGVRRAA